LSSSFQVVTNIKEIARLNQQLSQRLRKIFSIKKSREITYPSGHHRGTVYFESSHGNSVRAWSPQEGDVKLCNFILSGDPQSTDWIEISVQINFPAGEYDRRKAGAFITDENGDVFIGHRGKLTKGHAGLEKEKVFREFASRTIEATDREKTSKLILISALDDPDLADRLWTFGVEAREVATRLAEAEYDPSTIDDADAPPTSSSPMLKLRAYFDEYAGESNRKGHGGGTRTVEHGDIVKALEAQLRETGKSQKAHAIDLAIVKEDENRVDLYEVKTSARTSDIYTGVGQLLIHGECINSRLKMPVHRFLVLPANPNEEHRQHIGNKVGISVVLYRKHGSSYRFSELP
jgi:hypothetical protein